ncbi:MAG: DUF5615 family PIN-like protein [Deltaproteobacteria bacterium]|nr:DUF5615 family PIN-like protein [Deltaproteobacteria bacterium]
MKILLDECLPRRLKKLLGQHDVVTVPEKGWSGTKNGALLQLAASEFDVFITVDKNLQYQQNLKEAPLAVVVLVAADNKIETLTPLMPKVLDALTKTPLPSGSSIRISAA